MTHAERMREAELRYPYDLDARWRFVEEPEEPLPSEAELDAQYQAWAHSMASGDHPVADPRD